MTQQMKQEFGRWRGYFALFFAIHIFNAFFILSPSINNNMNPFRLGFLATANAFLGNFAILAFFSLLCCCCQTRRRRFATG
ncbi:MAG: hypothetical protein MZU97_25720 [Bacillus subtilis]|nr:hypothetical protein [Bacillus subtilis]